MIEYVTDFQRYIFVKSSGMQYLLTSKSVFYINHGNRDLKDESRLGVDDDDRTTH